MTTRPVSHRINAERLVLLGWSRAILMQMAHPLIAAGVADHSSFRASPVTAARRLRETVRAMLGLTFGTVDEQAQIIGRIQAIHRRVHGSLREDVGQLAAGTRYSAEDPALVLWVHTTLVESTVMTYEALVAPLSAAERDAYCGEASEVAIALGAQPSETPTVWADLLRHLEETRRSGLLAVGADARQIASALVSGPFATLAGPAGWINRRLTIGWLPESVRELYGFTWSPKDARQLARLVSRIRRARRATPARLAHWPDSRRPGR